MEREKQTEIVEGEKTGLYLASRLEVVERETIYEVWADNPEDALKQLRAGNGSVASHKSERVVNAEAFSKPIYDLDEGMGR